MPRGTVAPLPSARRILVIEDDDDGREALCVLLESYGYAVRGVDGGQAGVFATLAWQPDAVCIDLGLPDMSGLMVAQVLSAAFDRRRRPFLVAVTGYGSPEDRQRALAAGFDVVLVKPVDPNEIDAVLDDGPARGPNS